MNIPLDIIKNQLIKFPVVKAKAKEFHNTGANGREEAVNKIFDFYKQKVGSFDGKTVMEIGPGQTFQVAQKIKEAGAEKVIIIDVEQYLEEEMLSKYGLDYLIYDGNKVPIESISIDLILSYTVYEHLRNPVLTVSETNRLLKKGGLVVHHIDLCDHYSYGVDENKLFNCLRYSDWLWNRMTDNRSAYVNRLRFSDWIELHEQHNFEILGSEKKEAEHIRQLYQSGQVQYLSNFKEVDRFATQIELIAKKS